MARITVVDDDPDFLDLLVDALRESGHDVIAVDAGDAVARGRIVSSRPELLLADLRLRGDAATGIRLARWAAHARELRAVPMVVLTADHVSLERYLPVLARIPQVRTLRKPFGLQELLETVDDLLVARSWLVDVVNGDDGVSMLLVDAEGRVLEATAAIARLLGYRRPAELVGRTTASLTALGQEQVRRERQRLAAERQWHGTLPLRRADGTTAQIEAHTTLLSAGAVEVRRVLLLPARPIRSNTG